MVFPLVLVGSDSNREARHFAVWYALGRKLGYGNPFPHVRVYPENAILMEIALVYQFPRRTGTNVESLPIVATHWGVKRNQRRDGPRFARAYVVYKA